MESSTFQSKPDPSKLDFGFDFYELTFYFTTRGGDLGHAQVSGADDIIVTGSVPGLNIKQRKHIEGERAKDIRVAAFCKNYCVVIYSMCKMRIHQSRILILIFSHMDGN